MFSQFWASFYRRPLLLGRVGTLAALLFRARFAEVDAELPAVDGLLLQNLPGLGGASNIDEVCVSKASGLAGPPVNGHTDIHDVANIAEEVVEVLV